jgi:esterase/lipase
VRLKNLISVIANEIEPLNKVINRIKQLTSMTKPKVKQTVAKMVYEQDLSLYKDEYQKSFDQKLSKDEKLGEPIFLKSKYTKTGIVLCHGYLASPKEVEPVAQVLNKMGYTVYCVRLKGHGTAPISLKDITLEDWIESFDRGYAIVRNTCKHVFVGGFSAGGLVALLAAASKANDVKGVFTINAAIKLQDIRSKFVPSVMVWNDVMDKFNFDQAKMDFIENESEHPEINYSQNYLNGVRQLERLIKTTKSKLAQVVAPALIIQADQDPVVHLDSAKIIESSIQSDPKEKVIMPFERHGVLHGEGSEEVFDHVKNFITVTAQALEETPNTN